MKRFLLALLFTSVVVVAQAPSLPASNPSPADGATNVSLNPVLSWTPGAGATMHKVYFGTDPNNLQLVETIIVKPDPPTSMNVR